MFTVDSYSLAVLFTPYSAMFVFTLGLFVSNFLFNSWFMYRPVTGKRVNYADYIKLGTPGSHLIGIRVTDEDSSEEAAKKLLEKRFGLPMLLPLSV